MSGTATLARQQAEFMAHVLEDERAQPQGWTDRQKAGLAIYRGGYRTRLIDALQETFKRTLHWVGEEAFGRAAAHHIITQPPASWTLDDVGLGFDQTLAELFAGDPEVAELAWLEWAMHRAFIALDAEALDAAGFAAASTGFDDEAWADMRLIFAPGLVLRPVAHDLVSLWQALGQDELIAPDITLEVPHYCLVWREGLRSTFALVDSLEGEALAALVAGSTYGEACTLLVERLGEEEGVVKAGALLGWWLGEGLLSRIETGST